MGSGQCLEGRSGNEALDPRLDQQEETHPQRPSETQRQVRKGGRGGGRERDWERR